MLEIYGLAAASPMTGWDENYPGDAFIDEDIASGSLFVLVHEGEFIAAITMNSGDALEQPDLWTPARYCAPVRLCVRPDMQGRGLGRYMALQMLSWAQKHGFKAVRLLAVRDNLITCHLYEALGFRNVGEIKLYDMTFFGFEKFV